MKADFRVIKSNPRYLINSDGIVIDKVTDSVKKVVCFKGRSPQVGMQLPDGRNTGRAINMLLKENFPENYKIESGNEIIYHVEGTLPSESLNDVQEEVRKFFKYDLETGIVYDIFTSEEASYSDITGYKAINRHGYKMPTHRLIMLYMLGKKFPKSEIDHIDHNRSNNSWSNLRIVCRQTNSRNLSKHKANTSGFTGVSWHKTKCKWRAHIMVNYKQIHLGLFNKMEDAIEARKEANTKFKFHFNHGL